MKKREFNKLLKKLSPKKKLDVDLIETLSNEEKLGMVHHIIRNRAPIIKNLIPPDFDYDWLGCMGYLYTTQGKDYKFIHTGEHKIK